MSDFPHSYVVSASSDAESDVSLTSSGLEPIASLGPAQFGGPGDKWSPETLLVAAVADCFILSFRAIARASRFDWTKLDCEVDGTLDKVDRQMRFTEFAVHARLVIGPESDPVKGEKLLHMAEKACLVTNSLTGDKHLTTEISRTS